MIVYPKAWQEIGQPISLTMIEKAIAQIIAEMPCDCLSFSGGLDSSLLLYFMLESGKKPRVFTIVCSDNHPDIHYSQTVLRYFREHYDVSIESSVRVLPHLIGDELVKAFYQSGLSQHTDTIIAGDGIDEFMAGYYKHQQEPTETTFYDFMRRLQAEHLVPLNENSGSIKVYLPYLDNRLTSLLWQIPITDKIDKSHRKKLMVQLAEGKLPNAVITRRKYGFATTP